MFKGVSQHFPPVSILYFWSIQTHPLLSLIPLSPTTHFQLPYIFYIHRYYVLQCYWWSVILFSFPSFPEIHRLVPLLHTCSTYEFVYDYACFSVYVFLLNLSSTYERKHEPLSFWDWLTYDVLQLHQFIHKLHGFIIPYGWVQLHCRYI
jgi:hypothetical protein